MDSLIGKTVGRYQISRHVARGGMADVYLAEDVRLQRNVALKVLLPHLMEREDVLQRFQREAKIVARLQHPNIVDIYDADITDSGQPYMAMQYVEGGSLKERLNQFGKQHYRPPAEDVLRLTRQIADALRVAHEAGVIHRDVKPNNILLRKDGSPILADLGIAAVRQELDQVQLTRTGHMVGTPHYVSPEQARGDKLDPRSDLYSLGTVLYELLAGRLLFDGDNTMAVLHKHLYEKPVPLDRLRSGLAPATYRLVATCLQKEPSRRFVTAAEMVTAIDAAIQAEKREDSATVFTRTVGRWEQRWRHYSSAQRTGMVLVPLTLLLLAGFGMARMMGAESEAARGGETAVSAIIPTVLPESPSGEKIPDSALALALPTQVTEPINSQTPTVALPSQTPFVVEQGLIGRSVRGQPINTTRIGSGSNVVLFIGGFHAGYAPGTVALAEEALGYFGSRPEELPPSVTLYIISNANPDSPSHTGQFSGRLNANSVDLNRNWGCAWAEDASFGGRTYSGIGGPEPFSEPESQILREFIMAEQPKAVIFWEARSAEGLVSPGACEGRSRQSWPLASTYGLAAGYVTADFENITNSTLNGDAANWLDQQGIPTISVLLPNYNDIDWENNRLGLLAVLNEIANE